MAAVFTILIAIIIWLVIKNHDAKQKIDKLSEENSKLTKKVDALTALLQTDPNETENSNQISDDIPVSITATTTWDDNDSTDYDEQTKMFDEYHKVEKSRPDYNKQFGRSFNSPKYTDKYNTNTDFTLRELLLLVWWGRIKKGRLTTAKIPKYFIYDYNLNGQKVTQKFIDKGWLIEKDGRYMLSEEARSAANFYSELWEMHQTSGFPICLDDDFANWNHGKLLISFYKKEIEFQQKMINYYHRLEAFYKKYPAFFADKQDQNNQLQYVNQSILEAKNDIENDKERIQAIE